MGRKALVEFGSLQGSGKRRTVESVVEVQLGSDAHQGEHAHGGYQADPGTFPGGERLNSPLGRRGVAQAEVIPHQPQIQKSTESGYRENRQANGGRVKEKNALRQRDGEAAHQCGESAGTYQKNTYGFNRGQCERGIAEPNGAVEQLMPCLAGGLLKSCDGFFGGHRIRQDY